MREKALKFGPDRGLVGVLTEPAIGVPQRAPVVFLNSGILHHVGASRLYVQLARRLAADGHPALRFDFSGIGDSEPRRGTGGAAQAAIDETRAAMDLLQARKPEARKFILIGLCSGADMAFNTADVDERVTGLVQLDPFAYRTKGYYLHHYGPKLFRASAWRAHVRMRLERWRSARRSRVAGDDERLDYTAPEYRRIFPPREKVEEQLQRLIDRPVQMLNVFTNGLPDHINHRAQYARAFPALDFGGLLQVEFFGDAEHTITDLGDQATVIETVATWAQRVALATEGTPQEAVALE